MTGGRNYETAKSHRTKRVVLYSRQRLKNYRLSGGLQMADAIKWIAGLFVVTRSVTSKYPCARHGDNRHRVRSQILVKRMRFRRTG